MSLAHEEYGRAQQITRSYAYLGRYAHQDISSMREMTVRELALLAREVGRLLQDENAATRVDTD